ncbi:FH1/FH2 domain-containing protein 1 isoform X2 [Varanus komodoensis]|uniref:FH1/FH2 domain-containing protein 1 isoform X2 n=1 Tax=Varanus komodoensis TaxID=61221 RepID=UPI001CF76C58|nr:FH1/FH2 domain-containing protein 1 isoform X2 [Varanus komodoensis]
MCRLQYLADGDPFSCAAFPEPRRPPVQPVLEALPLAAQVPAFHRLLGAPMPLEDCAVQVLPSGHYLDLELSLLEQKDELEGFYEDISKGRRPILLLRTQLSVRVQVILEKLYSSKGPELRRSLFSLKQLFQEDKDLVPEFVSLEGLTCLITVGAEADQNYQNYILRALGQIMLFVDGMTGVIQHSETVQWLYSLCGSLYRLVVKMALKLLLVFVEYAESNAQLLIQAVLTEEQARGRLPWSRLMALLEQKNGADRELQVFAMTLINKTLAALPDQDSFYDVTDCLEQQGMECIVEQLLAQKGLDPDLRQQLAVYETALKFEDCVEEPPSGPRSKERRRGAEGPRGPQRSVCCVVAQEDAWRAAEAEAQQPSPAPVLTPVLGPAAESLDDRPGSRSTFSSASEVQLSVPPGEGGEQLAGLGERSIYKARFLENLAASQKEKMVAISKGRAGILAEVASGAEPGAPERWSNDQKEPSSGPALTGVCSGQVMGVPAAQEASSSRPVGPCSSIAGSVLPQGGTEPCGGTASGEMPNHHGETEVGRGPSPPAEAQSKAGWAKQGSCPGQRLEDLPDLRGHSLQSQLSTEAKAGLERALASPFQKDAGLGADLLAPPPKLLRIRDLDFSDLGEEDDDDLLDAGPAGPAAAPLLPGCPPAPPPLPGPPPPPPPPPGAVPPMLPLGCPPPSTLHPSPEQAQGKKKKTVRLFWKELVGVGGPAGGGASCFGPATLWASLERVEVDTAKLEHLFESRAKEVLSSKKAADAKKLVVVLDPKRSNAINIGLTVLPPIPVIKAAISNFDEFAIGKEGIEKILAMVPTEEEKQRIQEAQLAHPGIPLGSAEQFLLALSSVPELSARLQLWAFKLDYDTMEQEIAEPLFDLKVGMEQLAQNRTFKCVLATLLAMGNFLNGSQSRGFELSYLAKVSEVKDTVRRQTLLHHLCHHVVDKFPDTTDLYSEIAALMRSAKVDFDALAEGLLQLDQRCKASWESLKAIMKHDTKPGLKGKLVDFLQGCTQKIVILKVVHRRVLNRFRAFLLYLGYDQHSAQDVKVTVFCQTLREFALEYRTCRERVLQQQKKRAACRERNKTRGRLITELEKFATVCPPEDASSCAPAVLTASPERADGTDHSSMASVLASPATEPSARRSRGGKGASRLSPPSAPPTPPEDTAGSPEDASEEIMDRLARSVTQSTPPRPGAGRLRKRSRVSRKSLRRTLKSGLSDELVQALGLEQAAGVAV